MCNGMEGEGGIQLPLKGLSDPESLPKSWKKRVVKMMVNNGFLMSFVLGKYSSMGFSLL